MNSLSWLIYGADIVEGLRSIAIFSGLLAGAFALIAVISLMASEGETWPWVSARFPKMAVAVLIPALIVVFLPSRQAIYMIAASEMGQKVYETPATQEMLGDLQAIIKAEIKKLKGEAK